MIVARLRVADELVDRRLGVDHDVQGSREEGPRGQKPALCQAGDNKNNDVLRPNSNTRSIALNDDRIELVA